VVGPLAHHGGVARERAVVALVRFAVVAVARLVGVGLGGVRAVVALAVLADVRRPVVGLGGRDRRHRQADDRDDRHEHSERPRRIVHL